MDTTSKKVKRFFAGFMGRVVLTVIFYLVIWGAMLAFISAFDAPIFAVIFAVVFIYFGWKALSRITPEVFVIMPVGSWIAYFIIKGFLAFFLGVFVAPFVLGKALSCKVADQLRESLNDPE